MKTLILGGARSGKSVYAEQLVLKSKLSAVYIATATANDTEMATRIELHQLRRGAQWHTIEEPIELVSSLTNVVNNKNMVMVDCLTLWISNLLQINEQQKTLGIDAVQQQIDALCHSLKFLNGDIIFVSNEVGLGIVPMGQISRQFCDLSGQLHQQLAAQCDRVILMVAGIPQMIKDIEK